MLAPIRSVRVYMYSVDNESISDVLVSKNILRVLGFCLKIVSLVVKIVEMKL